MAKLLFMKKSETPGYVWERRPYYMTTINQLVRKGRKKKTRKRKSPVLAIGFNSIKKRELCSIS